ncbi:MULTISPECIES: inositol monophosphatase [unclassified Yoonia]|uniref:inositol monophosphatase family protein n=1 Tax=unclassified Yoonia TaxID=2629118 RepID=UPI002AFFE595|nr:MULTISPECIES: inositol monophosphatase [unclassified Yoonia]
MPISDLTTRAAFLTQTIKAAGDIARSEFLNHIPGQFELKGPQDLVTASDRKVEAFLRDAISAAFPQDDFLGEETGMSDSAGTAGIWVVDPIDGTDNFARGIAHFCVSIAYIRDGKTQLGAIYVPMTDDLYRAQAGQGAKRNGTKMSVSGIATPDQAAIELGWSMRAERTDYMAVLTFLLDQGSNVRRSGSGALALAMVADGRLDGYIELVMNAWDSLAGLLLVREAGGITCPDPAGRDLQTAGLVYAGNPHMALHLACEKAKAA